MVLDITYNVKTKTKTTTKNNNKTNKQTKLTDKTKTKQNTLTHSHPTHPNTHTQNKTEQKQTNKQKIILAWTHDVSVINLRVKYSQVLSNPDRLNMKLLKVKDKQFPFRHSSAG